MAPSVDPGVAPRDVPSVVSSGVSSVEPSNRGPEVTLIFLHIPKTGGTSVRAALKREKMDTRYDLFLSPDTHEIPSRSELDYVFTFVRDPYARAVSLYNGYTPTPHKPDFLGFLKRVAKGVWGDQFRANPQTYWTKGTNADFIGKTEALQEDLDKVLANFDLPGVEIDQLNSAKERGTIGMTVKDLTSEHRALIEDIYASDFDAFKYPKYNLKET